mgnify:CR=1 FL=1
MEEVEDIELEETGEDTLEDEESQEDEEAWEESNDQEDAQDEEEEQSFQPSMAGNFVAPMPCIVYTTKQEKGGGTRELHPDAQRHPRGGNSLG